MIAGWAAKQTFVYLGTSRFQPRGVMAKARTTGVEMIAGPAKDTMTATSFRKGEVWANYIKLQQSDKLQNVMLRLSKLPEFGL